MSALLIKEIIIGLIFGLGVTVALMFMQRGIHKIKKHHEETGSNNGNIALPSIGFCLLALFITTGIVYLLSHQLGVEVIYSTHDSRVIDLLGDFGRFNWHVLVPALIVWFVFATTYNKVITHLNHKKTPKPTHY